jgi:hypothetical protein
LFAYATADREDVIMTLSAVGALWPDAGNYARFRELCANAERYFDALAARGIAVERIPFDPDALAAWAAQRGVEVDSQARAAYAGILFAERGRAH